MTRFGNPIFNIYFSDFIPLFSLYSMISLRNYVKHSKECLFHQVSKHLIVGKNTRLRLVFSTHFSVFEKLHENVCVVIKTMDLNTSYSGGLLVEMDLVWIFLYKICLAPAARKSSLSGAYLHVGQVSTSLQVFFF